MVTVEGLAPTGGCTPCSRRCSTTQAAQCGFCISGIAVRAAALLERDPHPDARHGREALDRNLCRCGAQRRIVAAVVAAGRQSSRARVTSVPSDTGPGSTPPTGPPPKDGAAQGPRRQPACCRSGSACPDDGTVERPRRQGGARPGHPDRAGPGRRRGARPASATGCGCCRRTPRSGPDEGADRRQHVGHRRRARRCGWSARNVARCSSRPLPPVARRPPGRRDGGRPDARTLDVDCATWRRRRPARSTPARLPDRRHSAPRLDLPDKIAGRPRFIADLRLPGPAVRTRGPAAVPGRRAGLASTRRPSAAPSASSATARSSAWWAPTRPRSNGAPTAARRGDLDRAGRRCPTRTTSAPSCGPARTRTSRTVVDEGPDRRRPGRRLRARYSRPFLAHASIAPSCGVARWETDGTLSVWSHSQGVHRLRDAIAAGAGPGRRARSSSSTCENAGCYGHNAADDAAFDAVLLARAVPGGRCRRGGAGGTS